jgi:hypothetical protein
MVAPFVRETWISMGLVEDAHCVALPAPAALENVGPVPGAVPT